MFSAIYTHIRLVLMLPSQKHQVEGPILSSLVFQIDGMLVIGLDWNSEDSSEACLSVVVIMATASPCKFQSAVTTALGQTKWDEYEEKYFPVRGRSILQKSEIPPMLYAADPTKALDESQKIWEQNSRDIIATLW